MITEMKSQARFVLAALILAMPCLSAKAEKLSCISDAVQAAPKLIKFHFGELNGFDIDIDATSAKVIKPIKNSANFSENLMVVEVWGFIYKGEYRTRFIFSTRANRCLLVGQEILQIGRF